MTDELTKEFLVEAFDYLDQLDQLLLDLERSPDDKELLGTVFRYVHTIKGTCGFLGHRRLESVAHAGESLMSKVRDAIVPLTPPVVAALLDLLDAMRAMLKRIEAEGDDGDDEYQDLRTRLKQLADHPETAAAEPPGSIGQQPAAGAAAEDEDVMHKALQCCIAAAQACLADPEGGMAREVLRGRLREVGEQARQRGFLQLELMCESASEVTAKVARSTAAGESYRSALQRLHAGLGKIFEHYHAGRGEGNDDHFDIVQLFEQVPTDGGQPPAAKSAEAAAAMKAPVPGSAKSSSIAETTLRVDVQLLDKLMNLVGELVLVRNQALQCTDNREGQALQGAVQRLDLVTSELQENVMKTRMQPILNVWNKFPRLAHDLCRQTGKQVRVVMEGQDTELDKTILESIKDPLTHMIRNSIDHGIESPEERSARGKPEEGTITLRASHEGGQVMIELEDDGRGIDLDRIRRKVIEKGLVDPARLRTMSEGETFKLIFLPGFSTADKVTKISGRGVGMDVVKTNIEKIGGVVDIKSTLGRGTTIILKIPLTLAIIPVLMVSTGGERFAIPQVSLLELLRVPPKEIKGAVEQVKGRFFYRLRGHLIPLACLGDALHLKQAETTAESLQRALADCCGCSLNIVVLRADQQTFGLLVDEICDSEEIVVKPLGSSLKNLNVYAGATIMGNGRVALILDVFNLAQHIGVLNVRETQAQTLESGQEQAASNLESLLLFSIDGAAQMAVPLNSVDRLEEFAVSAIERAGERRYTQYRGEILPLVPLAGYFAADDEWPPEVPVIVQRLGGKRIGWVVSRIDDIVQEQVIPDRSVSRRGIAFAAIVRGKITEFVDLETIAADCGERGLLSISVELQSAGESL